MHYEDFEIDRPIETRRRVVTGTDIDLFAAMTGAVNPLFLSDRVAQDAGQPARLTPGPLQFSLMIGLCYQAGMFDHIVAMAGVKDMRFMAPVHPGDAVTATATPMEKRPSKKADRGVVVLRHELKNQRQQTVLTAEVSYLMLRKENN